MAAVSTIEWTDATWNPVRGCTKISPGCAHCYAATLAERFRGVKGHPYEQGFDLRLVPEKLSEPLAWAKPKMIFVNSMSDLFHEDVPAGYIAEVAKVMMKASWHTYQVLTKRGERMKQLLNSDLSFAAGSPHIWWGVSVENRRCGLPRIDQLRQARVPVRFLSIEPLLEPLGTLNLDGISWVIVGGESGPGARPMLREWVIEIRDQCAESNVPFFFKQWGGRHKGKAGRLLDGTEYSQFPAFTPGRIRFRSGVGGGSAARRGMKASLNQGARAGFFFKMYLWENRQAACRANRTAPPNSPRAGLMCSNRTWESD
jgi:protein gp37